MLPPCLVIEACAWLSVFRCLSGPRFQIAGPVRSPSPVHCSHVPLYLEWGPLGVFGTATSSGSGELPAKGQRESERARTEQILLSAEDEDAGQPLGAGAAAEGDQGLRSHHLEQPSGSTGSAKVGHRELLHCPCLTSRAATWGPSWGFLACTRAARQPG